MELATVLCDAAPGHALFLPNTSVGELLRLAVADDEALAAQQRGRSKELLQQAQGLAVEQRLPLDILDIDILLDNQHAVVQYLSWEEFDPRPFVSRLSTQFSLHLILHSLSSPQERAEDAAGCGKPDCGKSGGGGCTSCATGGGCTSCGSAKAEDVKSHFAGLRERMERESRTPLL
jgi:hypothetical protein